MKKPKECCNSNCNNIFYIESHKFFTKDTCDECAEKKSKIN